MSSPLISIITPTYNAALTFERTIRSIASQKLEVEFIVVDGGSRDDTIRIAEQNRDVISVFISEPDKGIYDAMNKGINRATGEWIYFLGADDTLQPNVLEKILPFLDNPYKVVYGDVIFNNNHVMRSFLGFGTLIQNTLHHQSAFYHYSLFNNFKYDQSLQIQADYELNLRIYTQNLPAKYVPILIATYALGGSSTGHTEKSLNEIKLIQIRYLKNRWQKIIFPFLSRLYFSQKQFRFWLYGHRI